MLAGPLPLNQYACRSFTTQSVCLPIFYHSFLHACLCCVSLFAIPVCMMSHDQPCLLVWRITIGHVFWFDASLSAMPSGVLSHHRPRLLQGSKIALVCSYLRVPQTVGQVNILTFLVKINFSPYMPIVFVMQGKCNFKIFRALFWCGPSLSTMPIGVVPHYRPRLLVSCHCN